MSVFQVTASHVLTLFALISFGFIIYRNTQNKKRSTHYQQELLRAKLEIQEHLIQIASKEIHDNIGQLLSLAKLNLATIEASTMGKDEQKLTQTKDLISQTIKDLRSLSKTLHAENIENIGFIKAIEKEVQLQQKGNLKRVNLNVKGNIIRLDAQKEILLYRVFQQALQTIQAYTEDFDIQVEAIYKAKNLELSISYHNTEIHHSIKKHIDIDVSNIKRRLQLIGATWQVMSIPKTETRFLINLPISD